MIFQSPHPEPRHASPSEAKICPLQSLYSLQYCDATKPDLSLFQISRMAGSHREAPVLREAPQAFKDVVYPPTEAHTTGMLEVLGICCSVLHCTELYITALPFIKLHCTALHCTALQVSSLHTVYWEVSGNM